MTEIWPNYRPRYLCVHWPRICRSLTWHRTCLNVMCTAYIYVCSQQKCKCKLYGTSKELFLWRCHNCISHSDWIRVIWRRVEHTILKGCCHLAGTLVAYMQCSSNFHVNDNVAMMVIGSKEMMHEDNVHVKIQILKTQWRVHHNYY